MAKEKVVELTETTSSYYTTGNQYYYMLYCGGNLDQIITYLTENPMLFPLY